EMPLALPPTPDGAAEDRLPHFPETGREYRSLGAMELKAGGLPVEGEEYDQPPALALRVADQRLVIYRQHRQRQYPPPMLGQPLDLEVPPRAIGGGHKRRHFPRQTAGKSRTDNCRAAHAGRK